MSFTNPDAEHIRAMLTGVKTIAVVGFSPRPGRPSNNIARAMQRYGFRIIPVRPAISEGLGEKAYRELSAVPQSIGIDLVNVFRAGEFIPAMQRLWRTPQPPQPVASGAEQAAHCLAATLGLH